MKSQDSVSTRKESEDLQTQSQLFHFLPSHAWFALKIRRLPVLQEVLYSLSFGTVSYINYTFTHSYTFSATDPSP